MSAHLGSGRRSRVIGSVVVLGIAVLGAVVASIPSGAGPTGVVLITLDTTRADRLSPYGYVNVSLPQIERLAREGVVFDQATTVAPLTLPAHASIFTGLLPPDHGVRDNADAALAEAQTTLAEVLAARGFRTGAFVASAVLDPERGLAQGFETYAGVDPADRHPAHAGQRPADAVMDDAIRWLDTAAGSSFFLWAHLYDPHRPYDPPEPYRSTYAHDPYLGEIAFADAQVGRLIEALERRGLLDRTVVVVTADHGESLGAHGERDHGIFVYEDVLRVPLIVRAPGLRPTRIGEVVRLTDVMPTILDLIGVTAPPMDGVSLAALMRGDARDLGLEAYAESLYPERFGWSGLRALRSGRFKLIEAPRSELFDLERDPFEEENLHAARPDVAAALASRVRAVAAGRASFAPASTSEPSPEVRARLAALGYVGSARRPSSAVESARPDPKDCIGLLSGAGPSSPAASCRSAQPPGGRPR